MGAALVAADRDLNYAVVANSRTTTAVDDPAVAAVAGDIADPVTAHSLVSTAVERYGRVDTLINNAGVFVAKPFTEYTAADYAHLTEVNLTGFFHTTQRAITQMLSRADGGHVVNATATLVEHADARIPSTLASLTKGGLAAVTKSLATDYAHSGIRVNAISPGVIDTPMHADADRIALAGLHPLGRMGTVGDIVAAVLYLETATFVTGETLHVDGGQSARH
jgi:NAD(P)-dependent dehydrogenase (short-subunit alcohol dehydrogenase family)